MKPQKQLLKGEHVQIFDDPMTMERFEGEAMLIRRLGDNDESCDSETYLERWNVLFVSDQHRAERQIAPRGASIYAK